MNSVVFIGIAVASATWFLLSLRPGSMLGIAFTSADWGRMWRERHDASLQTPKLLRTAGVRALLFYGALVGLCTLGAATNGTHPDTLVGAAVISGLLAGYAVLLAFTRAASHTRDAA
jgi:hypothetical protein